MGPRIFMLAGLWSPGLQVSEVAQCLCFFFSFVTVSHASDVAVVYVSGAPSTVLLHSPFTVLEQLSLGILHMVFL